jgi:phage shock protein C
VNNPGPRHLYRSVHDRWIGGVAAGVADYFNVDPAVIRILWAISAVVTSGLTAVVYLIMLVVVPLEPEDWPQPSPWQPGGDLPGASGASTPVAGDQAAGSTTPNPAATGSPNPQPPGPTPSGYYSGWDWRAQHRAERWQRRAEHWESRDNSGAIVLGVLLIIVGGLFAWNQIDPNFDLAKVWPFAIIAFGVFLVATSFGWRRGE